MTGVPKMLLVEDDLRTTAVIVAILQTAGFEALSTAQSVASARVLLRGDPPDGLLVDLGLPDGDGIDLIAEVRAASSRVPILALTGAAGQERVVAALRAGADGFLFKEDMDHRLGLALRELIAGGTPLSSAAAKALLTEIRGPAVACTRPPLTSRQTEVLEWLATGAGYAEIGTELHIGINTVRTHVTALYEQLGVQNRAEAINLAWRWGLLDKPR